MLNEELLQSSAGVFYLALQATLPFQQDTCFLPKRPSKTRSRALLLVRCTEGIGEAAHINVNLKRQRKKFRPKLAVVLFL